MAHLVTVAQCRGWLVTVAWGSGPSSNSSTVQGLTSDYMAGKVATTLPRRHARTRAHTHTHYTYWPQGAVWAMYVIVVGGGGGGPYALVVGGAK